MNFWGGGVFDCGERWNMNEVVYNISDKCGLYSIGLVFVEDTRDKTLMKGNESSDEKVDKDNFNFECYLYLY